MIHTAEEFVRLRTSEDPTEYGRAARDTAPEGVWREVIERYPSMRIWVAHNKTVPVALLDDLAADSDARVRETVAATRRTSPAVLVRLSSDAAPEVRQAVAYNPKAPQEALQILATDAWSLIAEHARSRLSRPPDRSGDV